MQDFEGRTAVVTGAGSGIGAAIATRASQAGMRVVLADIDVDAAQTVAGALATESLVVDCDVADPAAVEGLAAATNDRFGAVHLLVNNAGVGGGGMMHELALKDWQWVLGVNLWGVIHGVQSFLAGMIDHGEPAHVVNVASMAGHVSAPGMGPYNVSKYGVVALSEALRAERAGSNVGVSVLCPGWVSTRIHESERSRPAALSTDRPPPPDEMRQMMADVIAGGHPPSEVAERVFRAVAADDFWIFTHAEMMQAIETRVGGILAASPEPLR